MPQSALHTARRISRPRGLAAHDPGACLEAPTELNSRGRRGAVARSTVTAANGTVAAFGPGGCDCSKPVAGYRHRPDGDGPRAAYG